MLRYKTETRPGLVALYDIWPGNGAGLFLQPRSPYYTNFTAVAVFVTENGVQHHSQSDTGHTMSLYLFD